MGEQHVLVNILLLVLLGKNAHLAAETAIHAKAAVDHSCVLERGFARKPATATRLIFCANDPTHLAFKGR